MRIPESEDPWNMDSKLKFADRLKALLNTESRQDVDPYVFSEPEPFTSSSGATSAAAAVAAKNFKLLASKNSKPPQQHQQLPNNRPSKSKSKCNNQRIIKIKQEISTNYQEFANKNLNFRFNETAIQRKRKQENLLRNNINSIPKRPSRDHTLLYYPRAGDEISDSDSSGEEASIYQRHWFNGESTEPTTRSSRLIQLRSQLRRRLIQLHKSGIESETNLRCRTRLLVKAAYRDPSLAARKINGNKDTADNRSIIKETRKIIDGPLLVGGPCLMNGCRQISLPCTRHCSRHIMMNCDQQLFEHCTAKFSDNTQCSIPVFDVAHELPLCPEHARKRDNYHRKAQESKPKKSRKKPSSMSLTSSLSVSSSSINVNQTTMPRPKAKSRPKKRKRPTATTLAPPPPLPPPPPPPQLQLSNCKEQETKTVDMVISEQTIELTDDDNQHHNHHQQQQQQQQHRFVSHISPESHTKTLNNLNAPQGTSNTNLNLGLGLGGLGLGGGLKVELGDHEVFASLDAAEHDFGNVLNNLPADAFNDLFIGEYNYLFISIFIDVSFESINFNKFIYFNIHRFFCFNQSIINFK